MCLHYFALEQKLWNQHTCNDYCHYFACFLPGVLLCFCGIHSPAGANVSIITSYDWPFRGSFALDIRECHRHWATGLHPLIIRRHFPAWYSVLRADVEVCDVFNDHSGVTAFTLWPSPFDTRLQLHRPGHIEAVIQVRCLHPFWHSPPVSMSFVEAVNGQLSAAVLGKSCERPYSVAAGQ